MRKDVMISIKGTVVAESGLPDIIELVTAGRYYKKDGSFYISYKESEATGLEGVTTTLKVDGQSSVTLIRNGNQRSRLVLEKGRRHQSLYDTGFGAMTVGVSGCKIKSCLNELGGELVFNYTLDINSNTVSQNEVYVSVREAGIKNVESYKLSN
ncbi:MAG: DUF1934 domain-containing protein [Clostridia bacterium]|nr:DUF1934 domain-containing protein [Clostridia bacterium]MDR3645032.1 DUF1934 domain-containing protein [Clostridia bacterium]